MRNEIYSGSDPTKLLVANPARIPGAIREYSLDDLQSRD